MVSKERRTLGLKAAAAAGAPVPRDVLEGTVAPLLARMTLREKVAQITQLDVVEILRTDEAFALDEDIVRHYARLGVGSFLNSPTAGGPRMGLSVPTAAQWRAALQRLRDIYAAEGKVPPVYGIDSVHGANYVAEAVMFPHALNQAASFSPELAHAVGRATAQQTRAAGIPWAFAPLFDVAMAPRFPRVYETFGEDPWLVATMAVAAVQGLQGQPLDTGVATPAAAASGTDCSCAERAAAIPDDLSAPDVVAACMKHFAGYQASRSGYDRAPAWVPEVAMRSYFLPPFAAAVRAGVATAMSSYNAVDGLPMVASRKWTQRWLREENGFLGMLVTDWQEVYNQLLWHRSAASGPEAVEQAMLRSSIDMAMVPYKGEFVEDLAALVAGGRVPEARLDAAVSRVLSLKHRLGLLGEHLDGAPRDTEPERLAPLADDLVRQHHELSRRCAEQSVVLLKNERAALPLSLAAGAAVAVVGPSAESRRNLLGGWSVHWQGPENDGELRHVATVAEAFRARGVNVASASGVDVDGSARGDDGAEAARQATAGVIFVYGEGVYAELGGDVPSAYLPEGQLRLARELRAVCDERGVPLVGVYVGGRDRLLTHIDALLDAHLAAFYPGPHGAEAIAAIIAGDVSPSARLPITLHRDDSQNMPYWRSHSDYTAIPASITSPRTIVQPLYPFGHGLSYVSFEFSALRVHVSQPPTAALKPGRTGRSDGDGLDSDRPSASGRDSDRDGTVPFKAWERVVVEVDVTNRSARPAATPVLLFVADDARILPPEVRLLKGASRVHLESGASATVRFELTMDDFAFDTNDDVIDAPGRVCQPGTFTLSVEGSTAQVLLAGDPCDEGDWVRLTTYAS